MRVVKMVTERNANKDASEIRKHFEEYLDTRGTTVTLRKNTSTYDSMGRMTANTITESTIKADIQFVNKWTIDKVNAGNVQVGDGMLFVKYNADISIKDEVEFNSERWHVESQIEGEPVRGVIVSKCFIVRRNTQ